jgi:hypothetical protein
MCWCFNVRDHMLTTKSLVPMHRYLESGAVREYNHFSNIQVYVLVHEYRQTFRGGLQLITQILIIHFYNLENFSYEP